VLLIRSDRVAGILEPLRGRLVESNGTLGCGTASQSRLLEVVGNALAFVLLFPVPSDHLIAVDAVDVAECAGKQDACESRDVKVS
jgi:hypothetical protein